MKHVKPKVIKLDPIMSIVDSNEMMGAHLTEKHCELLITYDADVYDKESGKCIAKFRKAVVPPQVQIDAFDALFHAASPTSNRGAGTGITDVEERDEEGNVKVSKLKVKRRLTDGRISNTNIAAGGLVNSGIVGYFDKSPRFPYCRQTAFTQHEFVKFKKAYPIIKTVDNFYKELMPKEYKLQRAVADKTSKDFRITNTAFTTVTVNKNWQTAVHKDAGDFKEGFGNLVAIRKGTFTGGHFVVVRWGVGFDLQNGDLLLVDVHQWHGNTPIIKDDPKAVRLSLVMYYRENMIYCGTKEEELKTVKNRQYGTKLNQVKKG